MTPNVAVKGRNLVVGNLTHVQMYHHCALLIFRNGRMTPMTKYKLSCRPPYHYGNFTNIIGSRTGCSTTHDHKIGYNTVHLVKIKPYILPVRSQVVTLRQRQGAELTMHVKTFLGLWELLYHCHTVFRICTVCICKIKARLGIIPVTWPPSSDCMAMSLAQVFSPNIWHLWTSNEGLWKFALGAVNG